MLRVALRARRRASLSAVILAIVVLCNPTARALADGYPTRPIKIVVPFAPGGATDIVARVVGNALGPRLGQTIVVENRPGAAGNIAGDVVAKAPPDGYTLLLGADSLVAINPHLYKKMSFNPQTDLVPVASLMRNQMVLAVNPQKVSAKTLPEFVELARKASPALPYASIGHGSQHHLAMEMLKQRAGIDLLHVPYRGGGPAGQAAVAGDVVVMFAGASIAPLVKSGKLRGLAVSGTKHSTVLPELPTVGETYPGYNVTVWLGLFAPKGTPQPVLDKLRREINAVLAMSEVQKRFATAGGIEAYASTPEEFKALIRADDEKYGKLIKDLGIKVN